MGGAFCVVIVGVRTLATAKGFSESLVPISGADIGPFLGAYPGANRESFRADSASKGVVPLIAR